MSGEVSGEAPRDLSTWEKFERWMINEGSRRLTVLMFAAVHGMVFAFGFINYQLKDNLDGARATFGLHISHRRERPHFVLHFDVALILLPVCRTLISLATADTSERHRAHSTRIVTFHKLVAYSIVFWTWVHTIAHWNNFAQLAAKDEDRDLWASLRSTSSLARAGLGT